MHVNTTEGPEQSALLTSIDAVEALPTTVGRLTTLIADGDHDVREIVEVVSMDQALTANLLRRANSAAAGSQRPVGTVKDAVVRLGTGPLLSLAFAATVGGRMQRPLPAYGLAEGQLWRQSVAASLAADLIRKQAAVQVPAEASTAALLHDFGKVVLCNHFGPQVLTMLQQAAQTETSGLLQTENAVFGVNHAEIGGVVAARWRLPRTVVDGIMHHHETSPGQTPIGAAVSLAHAMIPDVLAAVEGPESAPEAGAVPEQPGERRSPVETHAQVLETLGLTAEHYEPLVESVRDRFADTAERYSLSLPAPS